MNIWRQLASRIELVTIQGKLIRVVESQEQIATLGLVDDLEEQLVLEELLETAKPPYRPGTQKLHYLLATPFRYPPLDYGSRFGVRHEPSLFYASLTVATALAENAFYRFTFWFGMAIPPPSSKLVTQHTLFSARYHTNKGLQLQHPPFEDYREQLIDPVHYSITQKLGQSMRQGKVEAFEYTSARDPHRGENMALFEPQGLACKQPLSQQAWLCETSAELVSFSHASSGTLHHFPLEIFLIVGKFPRPAA